MRKIPATGEALPVIGLGTASSFNVPLSDQESLEPLREVVRTLLNGGARVIDTAPSYGYAEAATGALTADGDLRKKAFLATKVSSRGKQDGMEQIHSSFDALRTDTIDLIQVHNLQDTSTQLGLLRELKQEGRVRYIGITHYVDSAHDDLIETMKREKVDFVQFNYSVGARHAEQRLLPYCVDNGIATLINRPFLRGDLFAKVREKPLPDWAADIDVRTWAQMMLKFVVSAPGVTVAIPATSNPRYMADNLMAGQGRMPDEKTREMIAKLFA
ncbi:aldo/keto reductase [Pseudomonas matsuisoli]|uniref:Aldo/keto reductase n=2 Tax=Pseudomonas matsuisoli TaxID=1515666 RepID=A0A917PWS7_9PSED|nr:aldo/keto reductase [Pseudomonas matsuisoli]